MGGSNLSSASFHTLYEQLRGQVRWGADDRRGALNHITPARLAAAASEVRIGRTVTLAAPLAGSAPDNPEPGARHMKRLPGEPSDVAGLSFAADQLAMNVHGDVDSHIDALCHVSYGEALYNGVLPDAVTSQGASELSIDGARDGIVGRGVLLDIPRLRGVRWLEPGDHVTAAELAAAAAAQQVHVGPGDLLFVRVVTGVGATRWDHGMWPTRAQVCIRRRWNTWPSARWPRSAAMATVTPRPAPSTVSRSRCMCSRSMRWAMGGGRARVRQAGHTGQH